MKMKKPKTIAPRLADGTSRETIGHGLPHHIREGIRRIAHLENQSVSWVLEQIIIDYFGFRKPEYTPRKVDSVKQQAPSSANLKPRRERTESGGRVIPHRPRTLKALGGRG